MTRRPKLPMLREALRSILKEPFTRKFPKTNVIAPIGFRGKQIFDNNLCISCGLCARDCPANAIEMVDFGGKKKPIFHLDRCIFCYECAESCPKDAITASEIYDMAGFDKNDLSVKPNPSPSEPEEAKR